MNKIAQRVVARYLNATTDSEALKSHADRLRKIYDASAKDFDVRALGKDLYAEAVEVKDGKSERGVLSADPRRAATLLKKRIQLAPTSLTKGLPEDVRSKATKALAKEFDKIDVDKVIKEADLAVFMAGSKLRNGKKIPKGEYVAVDGLRDVLVAYRNTFKKAPGILESL